MNTKMTPKDFFLHLGATITLYVAAGALIDLAFSIVNYAYPDQLAGSFYAPSMVWPISLLIVLVPILYVLEWALARDTARMPEKKALWIRRWRIYLTIFLGAALIIGDVVALLNTFLSGEITVRFVWKVVAILFIAGVPAKYYFFSLYDSFRWAKLIRRGNAWFGIILVLAVIISGFVIVGSPAKQRGLRFDSQRLDDLSNIQSQIVSYWQQRGKLPMTLADLSDSISGQTVPTDPDTAAPYEYRVSAASSTSAAAWNASFELCATFSFPATADATVGGPYSGVPINMGDLANDSWDHPAGHACFDRTIDPARYPVYNLKN